MRRRRPAPIPVLPLIALLALGVASGASAASVASSGASQDTSARRYVWDLSPLFSDHAAWEAERDAVLARIDSIGELADRDVDTAADLADLLDAAYELRARATRLAIYGFLTADVDTTSERGRLYYDAGTAIEHQALAAVAFVKRAILAVEPARLRRWMDQEPRLARHRRRILRVLREAPYTLEPRAEAVLESAARWPRLSVDVFDALHAADLGWRTVRLASGEEVVADRSTYLRLSSSPNRADRLAVARAYLGHLAELQDVFGLLYTRRIEADLTLARQRGFHDGIEAIWFLRDGMPSGSQRTMIEAARAHLPSLRRYVALRARALHQPRPAYSDLLAPPPGLPGDIPIAAAVSTALAALRPLGPEFEAAARSIAARPWMHLEPTPNKSHSYAIWPSVAGSPPYFFFSYEGSLDHSRRVAGGLALQVAFGSIPPGSTPSTRDDPGIYSNGVIYVGDMLHDDYLLARVDDDGRVPLLVHSIDLLWRTLFRWILVTELDTRVQERVLAGDPPGGAEVSALYLDLLRTYYGADQGLLELEDSDGAEWMSFPVPFLSYEHEFWPPAVAMAAEILEQVEAGNTRVRDGFWRLLGRGDLDLTAPMLQSIGVDMTSREPYEAAVRRMDALLDRLEDALDARG